jgi:hypothetical protein
MDRAVRMKRETASHQLANKYTVPGIHHDVLGTRPALMPSHQRWRNRYFDSG